MRGVSVILLVCTRYNNGEDTRTHTGRKLIPHGRDVIIQDIYN